MALDMLMMWIVVGLVAGHLAGFVLKEGGYGLKGDILLAMAGSIVGSGLFWALGVSPEAGPVALVVIAFLGAAIVILAQRKLWGRYA